MQLKIVLALIVLTTIAHSGISQEKTGLVKKNKSQNSLDMKSESPDNYHHLAFDDEKSLAYGCPKDDPRYTAEFFSELNDLHSAEISVIRFKKIPGSRFTKFAFSIFAAYYYLHDNNPRKDYIIQLAEKSMQENSPVKVSIYGKFIVDINPVEKAPTE